MSLVKWNAFPIPAGAVVESVRLSLMLSEGSAGAYNVYSVKIPWNETTATWSRLRPAATVGALVGMISPGGAGPREITLNAAGVALVQGWIDGTAVNNGLILVDAGTNDGLEVRSSEERAVWMRPKLIVTYH
jgi:acid phosphatase type 7